MDDTDCIFCGIIRREKTARIIFQDEMVTAFRDIHPITPVHVLIIPNKHFSSINDAGVEDEILLGHLLITARNLAKEFGLTKNGYRLVINTGADAGQSVNHLHLHIIGGRRMPFKFE
jgi:histidine triad (HIT) family protein